MYYTEIPQKRIDVLQNKIKKTLCASVNTFWCTNKKEYQNLFVGVHFEDFLSTTTITWWFKIDVWRNEINQWQIVQMRLNVTSIDADTIYIPHTYTPKKKKKLNHHNSVYCSKLMRIMFSFLFWWVSSSNNKQKNKKIKKYININKAKKKRAYDIWYSRVVPLPSTDQTSTCLISVSGTGTDAFRRVWP